VEDGIAGGARRNNEFGTDLRARFAVNAEVGMYNAETYAKKERHGDIRLDATMVAQVRDARSDSLCKNETR